MTLNTLKVNNMHTIDEQLDQSDNDKTGELNSRELERLHKRLHDTQHDIKGREAELNICAEGVAKGLSGAEAQYTRMQAKIEKLKDKEAMYLYSIASEQRYLQQRAEAAKERAEQKCWVEVHRLQKQRLQLAHDLVSVLGSCGAMLGQMEELHEQILLARPCANKNKPNRHYRTDGAYRGLLLEIWDKFAGMEPLLKKPVNLRWPEVVRAHGGILVDQVEQQHSQINAHEVKK